MKHCSENAVFTRDWFMHGQRKDIHRRGNDMKYTVYKFPEIFGAPRHFRFLLTAWLYAKTKVGFVCELRNNQTGEYIPYWV